MIAAIPMNENDLNTDVCISFGRAPAFLLYQTETDEARWISNTAAESTGGAGIAAAQLLTDNGVQILITPRCGDNAQKVLSAADVAVYRSITGTARLNLDALAQNQLKPLSEFHAGFHGHGK